MLCFVLKIINKCAKYACRVDVEMKWRVNLSFLVIQGSDFIRVEFKMLPFHCNFFFVLAKEVSFHRKHRLFPISFLKKITLLEKHLTGKRRGSEGITPNFKTSFEYFLFVLQLLQELEITFKRILFFKN